MLWFAQTALLLGCVALVSCNQRAAEMSEHALDKLQATMPGMTNACVDKARYGGIDAISSLPVDECFKMAPPERFRGIWRNDFEGSEFCPEPATECDYDAPGDDIWLSHSKTLKAQPVPHAGDGRLYQIEFMGRLTAKRGHFGHFGVFDREVIVDRVISLRPLAGASEPS